MKEFTSIANLGREELNRLVDQALAFRADLDAGTPIVASLSGKCVANLFFEPSTRTRLSFDLAAQRLGAHVITADPSSSSAKKGESLRDTVNTVAALGADVLVIRHAENGVPQVVAEWTGKPVINAGDGTNEHPTQALLDAVTVRRHFGRLDGLRVGIVGDIVHSRVAGSLIHSLPALGVETSLIGPPEWLPESAPIAMHHDLDEHLGDLDVVYLLRVQIERGSVTPESYMDSYRLDRIRLGRMPEDSIVMHPGPMNRGVEITDDVADSPRSKVIEQVRNAVPARMAVLAAVADANR